MTSLHAPSPFSKSGKGQVLNGGMFGAKQKKGGPERGRGKIFAQVKARANSKGKLVECSVAKDGGWGKTINVRC